MKNRLMIELFCSGAMIGAMHMLFKQRERKDWARRAEALREVQAMLIATRTVTDKIFSGHVYDSSEDVTMDFEFETMIARITQDGPSQKFPAS